MAAVMLMSMSAFAANYKLDTEGMHGFIQFKIKHLGYSWLYGRFDKFEGQFSYDAKAPEKSQVSVVIHTASVDSNHAERDKHLREDRFFNVEKFPQATFVSTSYTPSADAKTGKLQGVLTLKGVSKAIVIDVAQVGAGPDPWGGMRMGFSGSTIITLKDFGFNVDLGPASAQAEIILDIEGVKQ